ncbi:5801_t:CDS:2 [Dentiscutata heterogama]|uniref:5801_t:CDS:1 n=1 Tax=Dentiscutata heterogama TaxID=1316150 RepID=A0ACA9JXZ1_9GLOM|nr:5801_t:CDS:2 [Dentiscutata heterogama]
MYCSDVKSFNQETAKGVKYKRRSILLCNSAPVIREIILPLSRVKSGIYENYSDLCLEKLKFWPFSSAYLNEYTIVATKKLFSYS